MIFFPELSVLNFFQYKVSTINTKMPIECLQLYSVHETYFFLASCRPSNSIVNWNSNGAGIEHLFVKVISGQSTLFSSAIRKIIGTTNLLSHFDT